MSSDRKILLLAGAIAALPFVAFVVWYAVMWNAHTAASAAEALMRPTIPDLSEPLLSPRSVRRVLYWVTLIAALVALALWMYSTPGGFYYNEDFT